MSDSKISATVFVRDNICLGNLMSAIAAFSTLMDLLEPQAFRQTQVYSNPASNSRVAPQIYIPRFICFVFVL